MDKEIQLPDGGKFGYVITDMNLKPDRSGNTIYIISLKSGYNKDGIPIRGTHVVERSLKYIIQNFPDIYYVRLYTSNDTVVTILKKAVLNVTGQLAEIYPQQSTTIKIR